LLPASADIVTASERDIHKRVGDQSVTLFQSGGMEQHAAPMQSSDAEKEDRTEPQHAVWNLAVGIGINTSEVRFMLRQPRWELTARSRFVVAASHTDRQIGRQPDSQTASQT
jgi:hypothetical protein